MGFRNGAYATVWEVKPVSQTITSVRLSISRKDKNTGGYVQDFSSRVSFVGSATAASAARLQQKDRIKLGDTDVRSNYDQEKKIMYYDFAVYSFEPATSTPQGQGYSNGGAGYGGQQRPSTYNSRQVYQPQPYHPEVGDGEPDPFDEDSLPF